MAHPTHQSLDGNEHDRLYKAGVALVYAHLPMHGANPEVRAGFFLRRRLRKGVALLERVIHMNPSNWAAMWLAGMASRRAGDVEKALALFARAAAVCDALPPADTHADVWREAGLTAMDLGRHAEAAEYTRRAVALRPNDAGLVANLALAHLYNQDPAEAKRAADYALAADPGDEITRGVVRLVDSVLAGKRPCPRGRRDI